MVIVFILIIVFAVFIWSLCAASHTTLDDEEQLKAIQQWKEQKSDA